MSLETASSPSASYFLRKDKFFFSQENPIYNEQKAFLEEHISNLFFKKKRLLSLTSISKQIATNKLAKEFKERYNLGLVSKINQDKLINTYCATKVDILQRLKYMLFTKGLYKKIVHLNTDKTIPFDTGFFSCVLALPILPVEDTELLFSEVLRVLGDDGVFAFASFGPGTLRNFYDKLLSLGKDSNCELLVDKHDLGDTLIRLGFDSPILSSSDIVLKYSDPGRAYKEMRRFLYLSPAFRKNCASQGRTLKNIILQSFEQCKDEAGSIALNIELIAGHAWKGNKRSRKTVNSDVAPIFFDRR
ncbi:hypothetical protein N9V13_04685 [Betaproteobacteria bacterium]|nr:hypothetical protein [Betaproteobacteria bacterium]